MGSCNVLQAFPTAAAYFAELPEGLESHGECLAFEVHEGARRQVIEHASAKLTPPVARLLDASWSDRWIPEVHGLLAQMMLADVLGETAYLAWIYDEARRIYDRPFLRHLMRLLSPSLVLMGGASRWGTMHRGSRLAALSSVKGEHRVTSGITLDYPPGLFPAMFCRGLGETFRAAFDLAHASNTTVELVEHGRQHSRFEVAWDR